jgi:glycosyltransferase involved in cell wall biosynthesis
MSASRHNIAVNMLWCVPGAVGGSEEYFVRQLHGLAEIDAPFNVTVYAPKGFSTAHKDLASTIRIVEAPSRCTSRELRVLLENTWLASHTKAADIVHHGGGTIPSRGNSATLLTIHDVQYLTYPEYFNAVKLRYLKNRVPSAIRRASVVAAPSNYVREGIEQHFGIGRARTAVVRHGLEPAIGLHKTSEDQLRSRFQLGDSRVLLIPAITHPHKNHEFLLRLIANEWRNEDVKLVMVGGNGLAESHVQSLITELHISDKVVRSGRVNAADRDGLIAMAEALVFPSKYEGFGAPVLEAMALGTPVISSDCASLPEVIGDGGLVLPLTAEAWAGALDVIRAQRSTFVQNGLRRAEEFTSAKSAQDLVVAYEKTLAMVRQ